MNPQTACAALDRASFFPFTFFVVDGLHKAITTRDTRVHEGKRSAACFVSRDVVPFLMRRVAWIVVVAILGTSPLLAQGKRLWLLRAPGEMVEYDPLTFAVRKTIKVPAEAVKSPANLSVNRVGQVLFFTPVSLPLSEEEAAPQKVWIWNGSASATIDLGVDRKVEETGSNQAVVELAPTVYLSADGKHLVWFANQARRLQREEVDLSTTITWQAWQTDLSGAGREELVSTEAARLPLQDRKLRRELSSRRGLGARYGRRGSVSHDAVRRRPDRSDLQEQFAIPGAERKVDCHTPGGTYAAGA